METLAELDVVSFRIASGRLLLREHSTSDGGHKLVAVTAMTVLCTMGVGFYFRFLVALLHECKRRRIRYLVRLQPGAIPEGQDKRKSVSLPRAA